MRKDLPERPARGRPKKLDRDDVLEKAMGLFWRFGYEPTSMSQLIEETGTKPSSLYAEFGSKEGLFCAAVDKYLATYGHARDVILEQDDLPLPQVIEQLLRTCVDWFTDTETPPAALWLLPLLGCLLRMRRYLTSLASQEIPQRKKLSSAWSCAFAGRTAGKHQLCSVG